MGENALIPKWAFPILKLVTDSLALSLVLSLASLVLSLALVVLAFAIFATSCLV